MPNTPAELAKRLRANACCAEQSGCVRSALMFEAAAALESRIESARLEQVLMAVEAERPAGTWVKASDHIFTSLTKTLTELFASPPSPAAPPAASEPEPSTPVSTAESETEGEAYGASETVDRKVTELVKAIEENLPAPSPIPAESGEGEETDGRPWDELESVIRDVKRRCGPAASGNWMHGQLEVILRKLEQTRRSLRRVTPAAESGEDPADNCPGSKVSGMSNYRLRRVTPKAASKGIDRLIKDMERGDLERRINEPKESYERANRHCELYVEEIKTLQAERDAARKDAEQARAALASWDVRYDRLRASIENRIYAVSGVQTEADVARNSTCRHILKTMDSLAAAPAVEGKGEARPMGELETSADYAAHRLQELFNDADNQSDRFNDLHSIVMLANVVVRIAKRIDADMARQEGEHGDK